MEIATVIAATSLTAVGGLSVAAALAQRRVGVDAADWLDAELSSTEAVDVVRRPSPAVATFRHVWERAARAAAGRAPAAVLERQHDRLLHAGLSSTMRAEEFVAASVLAFVGSLLTAF